MNIDITAVICTHNRASYLKKAIDSLIHQRMSKERYEIIVVDNLSTDDTKELVSSYSAENRIRYLFEPNLGLCHARNTGWLNATGKYVAYLDDDAIAGRFWLTNILETFTNAVPKPGCVGGKIEPIWEAKRPKWLSDRLLSGLSIIDWQNTTCVLSDLTQKWLVGTNIAFPKEVLKKVGGFAKELDRMSKNLLSNGDIYIEKQIIESGFTCLYNPEIVVFHHIPSLRVKKNWFLHRYYWQGVSDASMQLLESRISARKRTSLAFSRTLSLLKSPGDLLNLILPSDDPENFAAKCFTLIEIGHIAGLLGAALK